MNESSDRSLPRRRPDEDENAKKKQYEGLKNTVEHNDGLRPEHILCLFRDEQ